MSKEHSASRRRGITASRARLTRALTDAGLRTQAALAERIADLEGLDTPPRDVVSRAFREMPVDAQTVERIARALDVEAFTLYKTADELVLTSPEEQASTAGPGPARRKVLIGGLVLAAIGIFWWLADSRSTLPVSGEPGAAAILQPLDLGAPSLVVLPWEGDDEDRLATKLRTALAETFNVAHDTAEVVVPSNDPQSVAETLRVDVVVDGEIVRFGRHAGIRAYLFANDVRRQIWSESLPYAALAANFEAIVDHVVLAVKTATGLPVMPGALPQHFAVAPVQDSYLEGAQFLDQPSNELNVMRAETRFEAALRQDANFARAHAGLCQALLEEHWMTNENRVLEDAGLACGHALQLDPEDRVVAAAHAHFLRRTGRNEEAMQLYEEIVRKYPWDAAAWNGLASSRLHAFRQTGDKGSLQLAQEAAKTAADADPEIWKPLFALGTMRYFDNDIEGAIAATEQALARDENEFVAANLGTFYLCDGNYEKAVAAYELAKRLEPGSYVGDEFLGMAHYFLGNFAVSAQLRERAIGAISAGSPELHEMWGNLGDSYRQLEETDRALAAYLRAAEIAERDYLRGTAPAADRAALAYYYTVLERLDKRTVPESVSTRIAAELDDMDASLLTPTAHRRMAQIWMMRGEFDKARASLRKATGTCKGYGGFPDLQPLVSASVQ